MSLNSFFNPYLDLSYHSPSSYHQCGDRSSRYQDLESLRLHRQRAEALAAQRARRARYLPTEDVDSEDDHFSGPFRSSERAHIDTRRQDMFERRREAEAQTYQQRLEEPRRQEAARLRQAAELERNRREQARRSQQPFGRGPTVPNHVSLELFILNRIYADSAHSMALRISKRLVRHHKSSHVMQHLTRGIRRALQINRRPKQALEVLRQTHRALRLRSTLKSTMTPPNASSSCIASSALCALPTTSPLNLKRLAAASCFQKLLISHIRPCHLRMKVLSL